jgi:hypothetical protein
MTSRTAQTLLMLLALPFLWLWAVATLTVTMLFHTAGGIGKIWNTKGTR